MSDKDRPRRRTYTVLDSKVLAVASEGYAGDWAAYIGAVRGDNFDRESQEVLEHGSKLRESVAKLLFPDFRDLDYRD